MQRASVNPVYRGILCLITALLIILAGSVSAENGDAKSAYIGEVRDLAMGSQAPAVFETLTLNFTLHVIDAGSYSLWVKMETGIDVTKTVDLGQLGVGTYYIDIDIDGSAIYESGIDGPYTIDYHLFNQGIIWSDKHVTKAYKADDFRPLDTPIVPTYVKEGNVIRLPTEMMVAVFNITKPEITFYYAVDAGESVIFHVQYEKLVGFSDNGDGILTNEDLVICEADLSSTTWEFNGNVDEYSLEFNIRAAVTMLDALDNAVGHLMLSLHYSSNAYQEVTEQKYDIDIEFFDPLEDVDSIGLVHQLYTTSGTHTLVSDHSTQPLQRVDFTGPEGIQGYYRWLPTAESTLVDTSTSDVDLEAVDEVSNHGTEMKLTISYPYDSFTKRIFHDPVVGVNPDNEPVENKGDTSVNIAEHDPIIFIIAAIIASIVIFGTFITSKKKKY